MSDCDRSRHTKDLWAVGFLLYMKFVPSFILAVGVGGGGSAYLGRDEWEEHEEWETGRVIGGKVD